MQHEGKIKKGNVTLGTQILKEMAKEREDTHFESAFNFLKQHCGWRPGCLHALLGMPSGGKTTLMRSILIDVLESNRLKSLKNIGLFLSEQDYPSYLLDLNTTGYRVQKQLDLLHIRSQQDNTTAKLTQTPEEIIFYLEAFIRESELGFLIIDNITTITAYESARVTKQNWIANEIKRLGAMYNIPIIAVLHTDGKCVNENLIKMNDLRGSRVWANIPDYFYVLQQVIIGKYITQTLRIEKHRYHECEERLFQLRYDCRKRIYCADIPIPFTDFKEMFRLRNRL